MLLVGYGKLANMILALNQEQKTFYIYNRTIEKVKQAESVDKRICYCDPAAFSECRSVFLALPPEACISFLNEYESLFPADCVFFHTATSLSADELKKAAPHHRIVPAKFAGHAIQAQRDNDSSKGTFVVPEMFDTEQKLLQQWLGPAFEVVNGTEDMVEAANKMAVEETMKLIVALSDRLTEADVSTSVQDAVLAQIPAGVVHAHLEGAHGAFAKQVLKHLETDKGDKKH
ncbi:hypothetical protein D7Z54_12750 [Salibacterium salarium]|uniref:Pyrroline-5-carboxylate reductase catalytic N-terminal domain-containing protein n=1 Tax=Salibacterium salarium TaxID=284579 RepID=A0A3R9Q3L5_9BACI|nr:hypothetical protein [Salibacterium salarium]RSL32889.1 hypothetical protein D7Z54_12750 [Salibacterium salarium]